MNKADMTDKELADRVVALGVGSCDHSGRAINGGDFYSIDDPEVGGFCAELFVQSWEVVGALMERFRVGHGDYRERNLIRAFTLAVDLTYVGDSFPLAVNLALVKALEAE